MNDRGRTGYRAKTAVCFLLLIALLLSPFAGFAQEDNPVRVLLTAFQPAVQLKIFIYGNYVLNNDLSFQRGSELMVFAVNNQLQVHFEGMIYLAGKEISIIRHQVENNKENGLRIQQELNLYPGDLSLSLSNGSLVPILTLPVEEYLHGVVPYEMSDEFPLEALKAQAIAARTYTLANLKADRQYDLEDNTNDQVFRGINDNSPHSDTAIKETRGTVLTYQGSYASTFYTASNGGFTESAYNSWGREKIPYLQVKEDPFDAENPLSIVRSATIPKNLDGQSINESAFLSGLRTKVSEALNKETGKEEPVRFQPIRIQRITPHTTRDGSDYGVMTMLRFEIEVMVETTVTEMEDTEVSFGSDGSVLQENSGQAVSKTVIRKPAAINIEIPVFPEIESALGLSINRNENEIVTVRETDFDFIIQFRRYGHGVGLSQRGAEQMAGAHGWDHKQILNFYFSGAEISSRDTRPATLPELSLDFLTTPGPVPMATPRPTLMPLTALGKENEYLVYVTGISAGSSLNLRSQPDFLGEILTRLYYGQKLLVTRELPDGWLEVKTDVITGFIRSEFVSRTADGLPD